MKNEQTLIIVGAGVLCLLYFTNQKDTDTTGDVDDSPMTQAPRFNPVDLTGDDDEGMPKKKGRSAMDELAQFLHWDGPMALFLDKVDVFVKDLRVTYIDRQVWPIPEGRMNQCEDLVKQCNELMQQMRTFLQRSARESGMMVRAYSTVPEYQKLVYIKGVLDHLEDANGQAVNQSAFQETVQNFHYYNQQQVLKMQKHQHVTFNQENIREGDTFQTMNVQGEFDTVADSEFPKPPGTKKPSHDAAGEKRGANDRTPDQEVENQDGIKRFNMMPGERDPLPTDSNEPVRILDSVLPPIPNDGGFNTIPPNPRLQPEGQKSGPELERQADRLLGDPKKRKRADVEEAILAEASKEGAQPNFNSAAPKSSQPVATQEREAKRVKEGKRGPVEFNQTSKPVAKPQSKRYVEESGIFHDNLDRAFKKFEKAIAEKNEGVAGYANYELQQMRPGGGEMGYIRGGFEAEDGEEVEIEVKFESKEWLALYRFSVGKPAGLEAFEQLGPERQSIWREAVASAAYKKWNRYRGDTMKKLLSTFGKKKQPLAYYKRLLGIQRR